MKEMMHGVGLPFVRCRLYPLGHVDVVTGESSGVRHALDSGIDGNVALIFSFDDEPGWTVLFLHS